MGERTEQRGGRCFGECESGGTYNENSAFGPIRAQSGNSYLLSIRLGDQGEA